MVMDRSTGRKLTRLFRMMLSLLVVCILISQRAVCGDASQQHQHQQQEAIVEASGHVEFSSQSVAPAEGAAAKAATEAAAQHDVVVDDAAHDSEDGGACMDSSLVEKEREVLKAELAAAEIRLLALQEEAESRQAEQLAELGSCGVDKDALRQEMEVVKGEAVHLSEKAAAAEAARIAREEAERLAAELRAELQGKLDAAQAEIGDLRRKLSGAEARAIEARQEAGKHADDKEEVRRKLDRTASELELAKKPREVSVAAILADVQHLFDDLVNQSADARNDLISKGLITLTQAMEAIQPYWKVVKDVVLPLLQKAMTVTEPQRTKALEMFKQYWAKVDDAIRKPAAQKWVEIISETAKVLHQAKNKWEQFEAEFRRELSKAGLSEDQADKVSKYTYFTVISLAAVVLLIYLTKPVLSYVVIPLVRTVLRLVLWVLYLPIRVLVVWPVLLILWVLKRCFRLAFGKGGSKRSQPPQAKSKSKAKTPKAQAKTGTAGRGRR